VTGAPSALAASALAALAVLAATPRGHARLARVLAGRPAFDPRRLRPILPMGACLIAVGVGAPPSLVLVAVSAAVVGRVVARRRRRRAHEHGVRAAVAELVVALAGELTAGRPPAAALRGAADDAGPLAARLHVAADAVRLGADPAVELRAVAAVPGAGALLGVAACWAAADRVGAPVADVLDTLAASLDTRARQAADLEAALAGSRVTVRVLVALPLLGLALGASLGAPVGHVLLGTGFGPLLLTTAAALDLTGAAWMGALTRRAVSA
jgi:tight adherence protein B